MYRYLIRRVVGAVFVMWIVASLVFFMVRALPGDPIAAMLFEVSDPEAIAAVRAKYGLDQPVYVQYMKWFTLAFQGDLGTSIYGSAVPVTQILAEAIPRTLSLVLLSFFVAIVISIPAGIISAVKKNTGWDHSVTFISFLGLSMPDFWLAILLIIAFAANLHWLPAIGYRELTDGFWPWFSHLILPAIAAGTAFTAIITRMLRSSMLEVFNADFMRAARSRGLTERRLLLGHALPNALMPVVTVVGIAFALLMTGSIVIENVFSIKGLGRVLIQGILDRDYPVVQGAVLVVSAIFVFANLLVDMLYTVIDPRIRYE